jgi:hypothetical protein
MQIKGNQYMYCPCTHMQLLELEWSCGYLEELFHRAPVWAAPTPMLPSWSFAANLPCRAAAVSGLPPPRRSSKLSSQISPADPFSNPSAWSARSTHGTHIKKRIKWKAVQGLNQNPILKGANTSMSIYHAFLCMDGLFTWRGCRPFGILHRPVHLQ